MEIDQLNNTLEDFQNSLKIHKQLVCDLIEPKNDNTIKTLYQEIERINQINQEIRVERGDL